jgi:hypothetical protein
MCRIYRTNVRFHYKEIPALFKFDIFQEMETQFAQQFLADLDVNTGVTIQLNSSPKIAGNNFTRSQIIIHLPKLGWSQS